MGFEEATSILSETSCKLQKMEICKDFYFCIPGILLKFNRDTDARILCSISSPFSKLSLNLVMRAEKASSWNSSSDSELRPLLNQATVIRHTLTSSELLEPKHRDTAAKNDFFPLPSSDADKVLYHSSLACFSSS